MTKPFIDSAGLIGRPKTAPRSESIIPIKAVSRSLAQVYTDRVLRCEIRQDGYLYIDTSAVISDKIKVNRINSIALAEWILKTLSPIKRKIRR